MITGLLLTFVALVVFAVRWLVRRFH